MEKHMMKNRSYLMFQMAFLFAIILCQGTVWGKTAKTEILVGTHLPLSGSMASVGKEQQWAYETAVADINKTGGIHVLEYNKKLPVRLVILNDMSDPAVVVTSVENLIKEKKVDFILSGQSAVYGVIPGCIVAELNQTYYHATASFIPPWQDHHFKWSTLLFFDMEKTVSMPFEILNSLSVEKRPRHISLVMEETYDALAFGRTFQKQANRYGYKFALDMSLPINATDYTSQIIKAKAMGVDAIFLYASVSDCITFIRQMKALDFHVKYLQGWKGTWPAEFGQTMGRDAQYVVSDGHWSETYPYPGARELGQRYREKFNRKTMSAGTFYALAQILWQAIEKAGTLNAAAVRSAVLHGEFKTVLGNINYSLNGVGLYPSISFQWINGKQEIVYPFNFAQQKLQFPPTGKEELK